MKSSHKWTKEQYQFLKDNIKGTPYKKLAKMFNEYFDLDLSFTQIQGGITRQKLSNGRDTRFEKGTEPFNKGMKQREFMTKEAIERTKGTRFKIGQAPTKHRPVGSERVTKDGYIEIKVKEPDVWMTKHRSNWEKVYGKVPKGKRFIFLDGNRKNNDVSNLMLVDYKISPIMNRQNLYTKGSEELQKLGITTAKLILKTSEREKL